MTLASTTIQAVQDIANARDIIVIDEGKFHGIVHGPASGATSQVSTDNGLVDTVARVLAGLASLSAQGFVPTITAAQALNPATPTDVMLIGGVTVAGDTPPTGWARVASEPAHAAKFQTAAGVWYVNTDKVLDARIFGVTTSSTDVTTALTNALAAAALLGRALYVPAGTFALGSRVRVPSNVTIIGAGMYLTQFQRTYTTTTGTIEIFNAHDVTIIGVGISYTPSTYTLGYGQTGFGIRNGSYRIQIIECGVFGNMNRGISIINSMNITVHRCEVTGVANRLISVVSDHLANVYSEMSDENSAVPCSDIWITQCTVVGQYQNSSSNYGINAAGLDGATDLVSRLYIMDNSVTNTSYHGIGLGGKIQGATVQGNHVKSIFLSYVAGVAGTGTGVLIELAGTDIPIMVTVSGGTIIGCSIGLYIYDTSWVVATNIGIYACAGYGCLVSVCSSVSVIGLVSAANNLQGIYVTGSSVDCTVSMNNLHSNAVAPIVSDAGTTGTMSGNRKRAADAAYSIAGTWSVNGDNS